MVEIIPQKNFSYGDGVPAYKSGEWPGSKPSRFGGSKLILKQIRPPQKDFVLGHSIHFPPRYSKEYKFVPGRKILKPIIHSEVYKPKKRPLKPEYSSSPVYHRNIGNRPKDQFFSNSITPMFQSKKRIDFSRYDSKNEYEIETVMNKKKRILSLNEQRNKMIICNPGDKNYKCVENSTNFFKEGGLIVGSTNRINYNKSNRIGEDDFYQTLDLGIKILNRDKIWDIRLKNENLTQDQNYVANLNKWEENTLGGKDKDKNEGKNKKDNVKK